MGGLKYDCVRKGARGFALGAGVMKPFQVDAGMSEKDIDAF
jgi:hypothetical protein